jgi:apolipoprotein N-acyltransferase
MTRLRLPVLLLLAAASGALLFLADFPVHAWPLQLVALAPLLVGLHLTRPSRRGALLAGVVLGLCHTVPIGIALEFPFLMGAALAGYITVFWGAFVLGARWALGWPAPFGPLAVGCVAVVVDFAAYSVFPAFGTAQCSARVLSAAPWLVQFVDLTGVFGLVLVTVAAQALGVALWLEPGRRRATAAALALVVALPLGYDAGAWSRPPVGTVRVAAMGWTHEGMPRRDPNDHQTVMRETYEPLLAQAVARGAKLVVAPETGVILAPPARAAVLARVAELARQHRVTLAFGYLDRGRGENHLAFIRPDGATAGVYLKTHLIPQIERYTAGTGDLVTLPLEGFTLGGMICQDDNFTDLARGLGRRGVHVVALPTNDWLQVKDYHLSNSLLRPIENRYAIVRGATNGTSAIVSPRGEVIVQKDHFKEGAGVIVADVQLRRPGTLYSRLGDWVAAAAALALVLGLVFRRRSRAAGAAGAALVVALGLAAGPAHATGLSMTKVHLVLPDCTAPTQPGQWPGNVPLSVIAIEEGCTSAPGGPASCSCTYLAPEALALEQAVTGSGWKPVPGAFKRSHRQCGGLDRFMYDRALLPGTYQLRAGGRVFGPLRVETLDLADTARVPARLPTFGPPCREPAATPPPAKPPTGPGGAPAPVPPRHGCGACAGGGTGAVGTGGLLALLALGAARGAVRRRRATPCRGRSSR